MSSIKMVLTSDKSELTTIEDYVKSSESFKPSGLSRNFDYELREKAVKSKLVKSAKRMPIQVEINKSSSNLVFSPGSWQNVVMPALKYWQEIKGDKKCQIGDYIIMVGGIKSGKDSSGKTVDH